MRWSPVFFLANGVFIVTRVGFELTTPVLRVHTSRFFGVFERVWLYDLIIPSPFHLQLSGLLSSSSLSLKCALMESGGRIGYEPTKMSRDPFWRSISRDTNVEASALFPWFIVKHARPHSNIGQSVQVMFHGKFDRHVIPHPE